MNHDKYDKQDWIIEYLKTHNHVDILDEQFVDEYIKKFNPKYVPQYWGAHTCRELGRMLSEMYHCNLLDRFRIGLRGCDVGMPKWCYCYELKSL